MDGIAEMFAEFAGGDRYESALAIEAVRWRIRESARIAEWKRRNRAKNRATARRYYQRNRERILASQRARRRAA